jgi:uncharacterized membrane protein YedE/YeeE
MIRLTALLCGLVCGAGVFLSGLFQPAVMSGSLGVWAISLGAATLAALVVAALVFALSRPFTRPLLGGEAEPVAPAGTTKVVLGDLMFGFGWGLAGYFPLAALVALGVFAPGAAIFLAAVLVGMILHDLVAKGGRPRGEGRFSRG